MSNKQRKDFISGFIFIFILLMGWNTLARASESKLLRQSEAVIYGLDESYSTISIPADGRYPQSYQITVNGTERPSYRVLSKEEAGLMDCADYKKEAVKVSEDGLVTVGSTIWYNAGSYSANFKIEGAQTTVANDYGTAVIRVTVGDSYQDLRIKVVDYSDVYYDQVLEAYVADNITPNMTELEKVEMLTKYPASFDYSKSCHTGKEMVITGGGDCWASTSLIVALANKLGMKAWKRNGNQDPGAGSGHQNALIESVSGNLWYQCEAGYNMSKEKQTGLRPYYVTKRTQLFCYTQTSDLSLTVYQYDGNDDVTTLRVPARIDGKTVTGIASYFLYDDSRYTEVVLPDTITSIGEKAFLNCQNLCELEIPASVTEIVGNPFAVCDKLTGLTINPGNRCYVMEDGILFSLDHKTLIAYPAWKTETSFTVPSGVETVGESAFQANTKLKQVYISDTVKHIGDDAFYGAWGLREVRLPNALETIGVGAFYKVYNLDRLVVPQTVNSIGKFAFYGELPALYVLTEQASYGEYVASASTTVYCTEDTGIFSSVEDPEKIMICKKSELYTLGKAANELTDLDKETTEQTTEKNATTERTTEKQATTERTTMVPATEKWITTESVTEKQTTTECTTEKLTTNERATENRASMECTSKKLTTTEQVIENRATTEQLIHTSDTAQELSTVQSADSSVTTREQKDHTAIDDPAYIQEILEKLNQRIITGDNSGKEDLELSALKKDTTSFPIIQKVKGFRVTAKKKQLVLNWSHQQNISGYEIQISLKKNYKQPQIYRVKASKKTYTVKKLKPEKKYYVRIRAYRRDSSSDVQMDVYGKWRALKVKTKK